MFKESVSLVFGIWLVLAGTVQANFPFVKQTRIIERTPGTELFFSDVCLDSSNQAHVIWSETRLVSGNNRYLFYQRFSPAGQPTAERVELTLPGYELAGVPRIRSNHKSKIGITAIVRDTITGDYYWQVWYSDGSGVLDPPLPYSTDQPPSTAKGRGTLAINEHERSVICWEHGGQAYWNSTYFELRDQMNQKIDSTGSTGSGEYEYVNAMHSQVSMNSSGRFVVVWRASHYVDPGWQPELGFAPIQPTARVFDDQGNPLTNEIYVACEGFPETCSGDSSFFAFGGLACGQKPDVTLLENGEFAVCYARDGAYDCEKEFYFLRRFNADGTPKGPNIRVSDLTECGSFPRPTRIMSEPSGNLLVVWCNNNVDGSYSHWTNMYAQRYDSAGQRIGANYRLNDVPATYEAGIFGDSFGADMNENGLVAVVGDEHGLLGTGAGIFLQTMDVQDIGYFISGDANRDYMINISDAVFLISYIFAGGIAPVEPCLGDPDGNGMINISDAVSLINYIFLGGQVVGECP